MSKRFHPKWPQGLRQRPAFIECLRELVLQERFTHQDISFMFGVSRERIRQICAAEGIRLSDHPGSLRTMRRWDDRQCRFVPTDVLMTARGTVAGAATSRDAARRAALVARQNARRAERERRREEIVTALTALAYRKQGAPVRTSEAWEAVSGVLVTEQTTAGAALAAAWLGSDKDSRVRRFSRMKRELSERTGIVWRKPGRSTLPPPPAEDPNDPYSWAPWVPPFHKMARP